MKVGIRVSLLVCLVETRLFMITTVFDDKMTSVNKIPIKIRRHILTKHIQFWDTGYIYYLQPKTMKNRNFKHVFSRNFDFAINKQTCESKLG